MRVTVLGAGWVADARHLPVLRRHPDVELVSVYDRNPERAAALAGRHGVGHSTSDLEEVWDLGIDAVAVCTSPWSHAELAIRALEQGCHVLLEKPMALDAAEAQAIAAAALRADRTLAVCHNFLFSRSMKRAERWLADLEVRYVAGVQLSSPSRRLPTWHRDLPGGLLFDEIPHMLYTIRHLVGGALSVETVRSSGPDDARTVEVLLTSDAAPAQVSIVFGSPVSEWHVSVVAEDLVVDVDLFRDIAVRLPSDGPHGARDVLATSARALGGHSVGFVRSGARVLGRRQFWGHDALIAEFVRCTRGEAMNPVPPVDAVAVAELSDEIIGSLD